MSKLPVVFVILIIGITIGTCRPQRPVRPRPGNIFNQPSPFGGSNVFAGQPSSPFVSGSGPVVGTGTGIANPSPGGVGIGLGIGAAVASPITNFAIGNGQSISTGK